MKRKDLLRRLTLTAAIVLWTLAATLVTANKVTVYAREKNAQSTRRVQERLDETLTLLSTLGHDPFMLDQSVTYKQKAQYLTMLNKQRSLGYLMLRVIDANGFIYREDIGAASDLSSREYLQKAFATGEPQVTDAFLAGADGKTVNYTVAVPFYKDGELQGAVMAAILGTDMEKRLGHDEHCDHVLIGSQMQYMSGADEDSFGESIEQTLHTDMMPLQSGQVILQKLQAHEGCEFWGNGLGGASTFYLFAPVDNCDWMVLTRVQGYAIAWPYWAVYAAGLLVILGHGWVFAKRRKGEE